MRHYGQTLIRVNGVTVYGGIFLDVFSQMAIRYPVIRAEMSADCAKFAILPVHIPFVMSDPGSRSETKDTLSFPGEFERDLHPLDKEGFLSKKLLDIGSSEQAVFLREIIHDERIRSIFKDS